MGEEAILGTYEEHNRDHPVAKVEKGKKSRGERAEGGERAGERGERAGERGRGRSRQMGKRVLKDSFLLCEKNFEKIGGLNMLN